MVYGEWHGGIIEWFFYSDAGGYNSRQSGKRANAISDYDKLIENIKTNAMTASQGVATEYYYILDRYTRGDRERLLDRQRIIELKNTLRSGFCDKDEARKSNREIQMLEGAFERKTEITREPGNTFKTVVKKE